MSNASQVLWESADKRLRVEIDFAMGLMLFTMHKPDKVVPVTAHCQIECATAMVVACLIDLIAHQTPAVPGVSAEEDAQGADGAQSAPTSPIPFDSGSEHVSQRAARWSRESPGARISDDADPLSFSEIDQECAE